MQTKGNEVRLCVVLVNYNGAQDTIACLKSIRAQGCPGVEVVVVDNASPQGLTAEQRVEIGRYSHLICSSENGGFSAGNNQGIRYALEAFSPRYILLLNNDTELASGTLESMLELAEAQGDSCGIVTCKTVYYDKPDVIWYGGGTFDSRTGFTTHEYYGQKDPGESEPRSVSFVSGCVMLVPSSLFSVVGLFEESYFLYAEDTDFCCRVARAGYSMWYCPCGTVFHKVSASAGRGSALQQYYMIRNGLYVASRYCANPRYAVYRQVLRLVKDVLLFRRSVGQIIAPIRAYRENERGPL